MTVVVSEGEEAVNAPAAVVGALAISEQRNQLPEYELLRKTEPAMASPFNSPPNRRICSRVSRTSPPMIFEYSIIIIIIII